MTRVWDESPYARDLLLAHLAMADFANDEGYFWAKQTSIAAKTRCTPRYVKMIVARMQEDGYLRVVKKGRRNTYYLTWPDPIGEASSPSIGEIHDSDRGTPVPLHIEPSVEPSGREEPSRKRTAHPSGRGEGEPVVWNPAVLGEEPDFDDTPRPRPKKKQAPPEGTHAWVVAQFHNAVATYGRTTQYSRGHLNRLLKDLRTEGFTNDHIVRGIHQWAVREQDTLRTAQHDPVDVFHRSIQRGLLRGVPKERRTTSRQRSANEELGLTS